VDSRREFLKKAALLAAGGGIGAFPASIQKAFAIDPAPGTTYLDAEHVVILMQENRSFDHVYGTLRGVRGFNDPRAVALPNGNPVWLQSDAAGATYAPFRLNIKGTKSTWMGELPHGRQDQGEARNDGKHDRWLVAKRASDVKYAGIPLTLGYYNRADLPFHYALADAFTVCDQNFCSVIGPTIPNRLYLWTGTVRPNKSSLSRAHVQNEDTDFGAEVSWMTFPERLEELGVTWRNYQNELGVANGLEGDADAWLSNFADNPLEFFTQYRVRFAATHRRHLAESEKKLAGELAVLDSSERPGSGAQASRLAALRVDLQKVRSDMALWSDANFSKLSPHEQNLHLKAFTTNEARPDYRELTTLSYRDGGEERRMLAPKGDVLHQFREDVRTGRLPTVSWIIAPEKFSDHPCSPWYGIWYLSETLDILTQNPDVWRKTILILCYDENDGYFDHVPPFVPPCPGRAGTGRVSAGIDTSIEHVLEDEQGDVRRNGPIGLGYRVPLVVASPWSRGGYVCSEVFDHTSILRMLEDFLTHKIGRPVMETNISDWRRTVCGDMSSVFRPFYGERIELPAPLRREALLAEINQAQYRPVPEGFRSLSAAEVELARSRPDFAPVLPRQENGVRPSCALPYELAVDGALSGDGKSFTVQFCAGRERFGDHAAGAAFHVYSPGRVRPADGHSGQFEAGRTWAYAVSAGGRISDAWSLGDFETGGYFLRVHGPNGFFREFRGTAGDPPVEVLFMAARTAEASFCGGEFRLANSDPGRPLTVLVDDLAYGGGQRVVNLAPSGSKEARCVLKLDLGKSFGWHDLAVRVQGFPDFEHRFAGRVETGADGFSDPHMGRATG